MVDIPFDFDGSTAFDTISLNMIPAMVVGECKHVGIFISDTEFIHSSTSKMKVIRASLSQLPYVFPLEYEFRKE
jgi:hypothetical protein